TPGGRAAYHRGSPVARRVAAPVPRPDLHHAAVRVHRRRHRRDLQCDRGGRRRRFMTVAGEHGSCTYLVKMTVARKDGWRNRGRVVTGWHAWFATQRTTRDQAGLQRTLAPRDAAETTIDLAGNDYLGLRNHPEVRRAAADAAWHWGAGAGASRLVTGTTTLHTELERELAEFTGHAAGLVFSTGYQANLAVVTALVGRDGFVVSDAHVHASLIDAARLSRATVEVVTHNDVAAVQRALDTAAGRPSLVLTEAVFSVLGDTAPL